MLRLREFIKKIRSCKTAEEERSLVNKESAEIRNLSKDEAEENKMRSLAKCIFMSLLGYHTEFIQMTCIGLLAGSSFSQKRLAYLGLSILMDENSEVLLLISHTIKKDLDNRNQFIVASALTAIGELCTADMCRDCSASVIKLLSSTNPYIKKKAALALTRIAVKCPELIETIGERLNIILDDKNHGVLLSGLSLCIEIFKLDPSYIDKYKKYLPSLMKYLKNLININYSPEYDINGVTDPFLQVKILEMLSYFGKSVNEEMNNLLATISTNTETIKGTGNAVLYEVVKTIISISTDSSLTQLASNILAKFLSNKENNYKYIALTMMKELAKKDISSIQKHRNVIFECLKDPDLSIKKNSLDLIYILCDKSTVRLIVKEFLNFLVMCENEMKTDVTEKILNSALNYGTSLKWEIDTFITMLCLSGNFISDSTTNSITDIIIETSPLHVYSMFKLLIAMKSNLGQEGLIKVGVYALGELYEKVKEKEVNFNEETVSFNDETVIELLTDIQERKFGNIKTQQILVNCYFKILQKNINEKLKNFLQGCLAKETHSFNFEIQQRATEYLVFNNNANDEMKKIVGKSVPVRTGGIEMGKGKKIIERVVDEDTDLINLISDSETKAYDEISIQKDKQLDLVEEISADKGILDFSNNNNQKDAQPIQKNNLINEIQDIFASSNVPNVPEQKQSSNFVFEEAQKTIVADQPQTKNLDDLQNIFSLIGANQNKDINPSEAIKESTGGISNEMNQLDLLSQQLSQMHPSEQQQQEPQKKMEIIDSYIPISRESEIFKNSEISLISTIVKESDGVNAHGEIFANNNTDDLIVNVKINFFVKKHVSFKVASGSSSVDLKPGEIHGIRKDITIKNNDITKPVVIKINISYSHQNNEKTESFFYTLP